LAKRCGPRAFGLAAPLFFEVIVPKFEPLGPAQAPRPVEGGGSQQAGDFRQSQVQAGRGDYLDFQLASPAGPVIFLGNPNSFVPKSVRCKGLRRISPKL
jgi:hypothetical protein